MRALMTAPIPRIQKRRGSGWEYLRERSDASPRRRGDRPREHPEDPEDPDRWVDRFFVLALAALGVPAIVLVMHIAG